MDTTPTDTTSSDTPDSTIVVDLSSDSNSSSDDETSSRLFDMADKKVRYRLKVTGDGSVNPTDTPSIVESISFSAGS